MQFRGTGPSLAAAAAYTHTQPIRVCPPLLLPCTIIPVHTPLPIMMLELLRSRCSIGGEREWRWCMPRAMERARPSTCAEEEATGSGLEAWQG